MKEVIIQALGRDAAIGTLYDIRTDTIIHSSTIQSPITEEVLINNRELSLVSCDTPRELFDVLNLDESATLNILTRFPNLQSNFKRFLTETVDESSAKGILVYKVRLTKEQFENESFLKKANPISPTDLSKATHFIEGIVSGFNTYFTFEYTDLKEDQKKDAREFLSSQLKEFEKAHQLRKRTKFLDNTNEWIKNLKINVYGELITSENGNPKSFENVPSIIMQLRLTTRSTQAIQMEYIVKEIGYLEKFNDSYKTSVIELVEAVDYNLGTFKAEDVFLDINRTVKDLEIFRRMLETSDKETYSNKEELLKYVQDFYDIFEMFQGKLKIALSIVRTKSDSSTDHYVRKLFEDFYSGKFSPEGVKSFLADVNYKPQNVKQEINLLLMGETGVGKSTFINAFANYLSFGSLEEAESSKLLALIRTSFNMHDELNDGMLITCDSVFDTGHVEEDITQSQTQVCKTYVLHHNDIIVRFIDTPGIGDTRGIEKDRQNIENILSFVSNYPVLNGILILLKPNNTRLTTSFSFCITEILCHLHKSAHDNIHFVFTNGRSTFFRIDASVLSALFQKICAKYPTMSIPLTTETMYCFDSEPFRYLASIKQGFKFSRDEREDVEKCWGKSWKECKRLIGHVSTLIPHQVQDMLSVNETRRIIVGLSGPIALISSQIKMNQYIIEDQLVKIKRAENDKDNLMKELNRIEAEQLLLKQPVENSPRGSLKKSGPIANVFKILKRFASTKPYPVKIEEPNLTAKNPPKLNHKQQLVVDLCETHIEKARRVIEDLESKRGTLEEEHQIISETARRFTIYLKRTAIATFNDSVDAYLDQILANNNIEVDSSLKKNRNTKLEKIRAEYKEQSKFIEEPFEGSLQENITAETIEKDIYTLYSLKINGPEIKNMVEEYENIIAKGREEFSEFIFNTSDFKL